MDIGQLLLNSATQVDSANLADAGHQDVRVMDYGIKPLHYTMKTAGPAYTINQPGGTNLPILQAIAKAPAGSVLVVNAQGFMESGHVGGLIALASRQRGIAGIVLDGAVRDVPDIIEMDFPVFARGAVPRGNAPHPGELNQRIVCGGVQVNPGDIIFADATGVVVLPADKAEAIYQEALSIAERESGFVEQIKAGKTLLEIPEFESLHDIAPAR